MLKKSGLTTLYRAGGNYNTGFQNHQCERSTRVG